MNKKNNREERLQTILECSNIGTWEWNVQTGETIFNEAWAQIVGYTLDELAPVSIKTWERLAHPDDLEASGKLLERHFSGEFPYYDFESRMRHKDGHWVWVHDRGKVISWTDDGKPLVMFNSHEDVTELKRTKKGLAQIQWMLSEKEMKKESLAPAYGDLTELNINGLILSSLGKEQLMQITSEYLDLLETSSAVYEKNGDYALGIFSSSWCQLMDTAARKLCKTDNNKEALSCGKWLCHESCWQEASIKSIESGRPVDVKCTGGIRLYAVPIRANGVVIGAINLGYGNPPDDDFELQKLSDLYQIPLEILHKASQEYHVRPQYIIDYAKKRIQISATYIGSLVERKRAEDALRESEEKYRLHFLNMNSYNSLYEVVTDKDGKPCDFRFIMVNPAYEKYVGKTATELIGKTLREVYPATEQYWIDKMTEVASSGVPNHFENFSQVMNTHTEINLYVPQKGQLAMTTGNIDDRRLAEQALQESERHLRNSQRIAHLGSWRLDVATNQVIWTEELYNMYGIDPALPPPPYSEHMKLFVPESWERLSAALANTKETGIPYELELNIVKKDGSNGWMWVRGEAIKDSEGNTIGLWGAAQDITDRKKAENKLQESEEKYRAAFMTSPDSVNINRMDGLYVDINEGFTGITGYTRKDVIGKLSSEINIWSTPEDREKLVKGLKENGNVENLESVFKCKDGSLRTGLMSARVVTINDEPHILSVTRDITDRKKAEQAIAAEKERLAVTLRSIGDGVITTDTNGNVVLMNNIAEELTGWKQDEALGKSLDSVFAIIHEITRQPCENPVQRVLSTGNVIELANHTVLISRDGTERIIANSGAPIKDKDDHSIGVVLVFRDMTEKQKFLEITQNSQKLESLGVLAGGIAHDFNNLLGGIYGYIDMAAEEPEKNDRITQYLSKAMNTIDRARDLTRQLLTFSKGGAPVQKVEEVFSFVQETTRFALSGSNVTCNFDVPNDLWPCNYDKNQIGQVIDNLVINAMQSMPMGGAVAVTARNITLEEKEHPVLAKGDYVRISIKDSGIGIPREMLSRIFDPFFTTKSKGHGLGLATCYSIMNRHGGSIEVDSDPGKGSVFHLHLPAAEAASASIDKQKVNQHKGSGTFLVMDDEEVMREILSDMLKAFGYDVVCNNNGNGAVDYFTAELKANRPICGMIFDLTVPGGMGGVEAVAEVRKIDSETPVFVASGYADGPAMKNPVEYGFTASICKPFRRAELMEMLEKHMKARESK